MSSANGHEDIVFSFTMSTWEDACRRGMAMPPDRLVQTLLRHPRVGRLLIADPFRSPMTFARRALGRESAVEPPGGKARLFSPKRLRREDPVQLEGVERDYGRYGRSLERRARSEGFVRPPVITMHPFVAAFAPLDWAGQVTLYIDDDWASHPSYEPWAAIFEEAYARVRSRGLRVCAVSSVLLDRVAPTGAAAVVPNGLDPDEWRTPGEAPAWFVELPGPRILYIGTLDDRIDIDLVLKTAAAHADASVILVGWAPDLEQLTPLREAPNVHLHPLVSRSEITALVHAADVCIIPHRRTRLTASMSPLKAYEYLAAGRPVVAVDLPPLRDIDPGIALASSTEEFVAAVSDAARRGPRTEQERLRLLEEHAWRRRHEQVLDLALS